MYYCIHFFLETKQKIINTNKVDCLKITIQGLRSRVRNCIGSGGFVMCQFVYADLHFPDLLSMDVSLRWATEEVLVQDLEG